LLLGPHGITPPQVSKGDHHPAQLRTGAQHRVRDHWRQPHLQAVDVPAAPSDAAGREADGEASRLLLTAGVVDEHSVAKVYDHLKVDEILRSIGESSHADPRHPAWP
jgi:hypothetical protein